MSAEPAAADFKFDVFISYSRKDAAFARRLEQSLKAYTPPRDLPVPQRTLRVFRDESDFIGTEYNHALRSNLQAARKLLVVCSPNAVRSRFVDEEIRLFSELRGPEHIVTVLLAGRPNDEAAAAGGEDEAFPASLVAALPTPLANDFRGVDPQRHRLDRHPFENAWFKTLADLFADYGISRAQVEQREKLRQARRRRATAAITGAVMISLAALAIWALISQREAVRQRQLAVQQGKLFRSGFLASESINRIDQGFDLRSLLAVEAYRAAPTPQAREALLLAMQREPNIVKVQTGHQQEIAALAFSPDGRRVASADKNRVLIWPVAPGSTAQVITGVAATSALAFAGSGQDLVTGHADGIVRVWNVRGKPALRLALGSPGRAVTSVASAPAGLVIAGYADGSVRSFHRATGRETGAPARPQDAFPIAALRVSKDGREFAAVTRDGRLSRGRIANGRATFDLRAGEGYEAAAAAISDDLALYATGGFGPDVALSDARSGERLGEISPNGGFILALALSPASNLLAVGLQGGRIALWNTETRRPLGTPFEDHTTDVTALAFSADGFLLVSGSRDGRIVLWRREPVDRLLTREDLGFSDATAATVGGDAGDLVAGTEAGRIEFSALHAKRARRAVDGKHRAGVTAIAVADRGGRAASGDRSGHVLLWAVPRAEVLAALPPRSSEIRALRFSRDAARLLVLESAGLLTFWDATRRPPSLLLETKVPAVQEPMPTLPIAFSPDGRTAVLGGSDRTVRAWTVPEAGTKPAKPIKPRDLFTNPLSFISSLAFDPAGEMIAIGGGLYDGGVVIWDRARDGLKHYRLGGANLREVTALAFSPDGKQLASADGDGEVSLWDMDTGRLIGQPFRVLLAGPILQLRFAASGHQLFGLTQEGKALVWNLDPAAWTETACAVANRGFTVGERQTLLLGIAGSDPCATPQP